MFQTQFDCKEKMKGKIDESEGIYLTLNNPFKEANNSAVCTLNWLIDLLYDVIKYWKDLIWEKACGQNVSQPECWSCNNQKSWWTWIRIVLLPSTKIIKQYSYMQYVIRICFAQTKRRHSSFKKIKLLSLWQNLPFKNAVCGWEIKVYCGKMSK